MAYDSCPGFHSLHIAPLITYGTWIFFLLVFCGGLFARSFMVMKLFALLFYALPLMEIACIVTYLYFGSNLYGDCYVKGHYYNLPRLLSAIAEGAFAINLAIQCNRGVKYLEKAEMV